MVFLVSLLFKKGMGEGGAHLILWPRGVSGYLGEGAYSRKYGIYKMSVSGYEWGFFVYYVHMLFFFFLKSKNKKAAALPFVLAAPLDPEKGMDSNYSRTPVTSSV